MQVGIIGSGKVGQALALGFIKHNHEVMIGTSKKEKYPELGERTGGRRKSVPFMKPPSSGRCSCWRSKVRWQISP